MVDPSPISIRNISLSYGQEFLFSDLNFELITGVWTCLLGPSGVGKSSLLRHIAHINQEDNIAYMAQTDLLLPWLTALNNVLLYANLKGFKSPTLIRQAKELLVQVGLQEKDLTKYPHQLSGGMRQRIALVRTLIQNKPIVLMDEPFSAVDAITRFKLQNLACELLHNKTVLLVTHDPLEALRLGQYIYVLSGKPATLSDPLRLYSNTPRTLSHPELIEHQAILFDLLLEAKEMQE